MAALGSWSFRFRVAPKRTREREAKWGQSPLETTRDQQVKWGQSPLGVHLWSRIIFALGLTGLVVATLASCSRPQEDRDYPYRPVPFTSVTISDSFWQPRLETNRKVTIPYAFQQCEQTGRIDNFRIAGGIKEGDFCSEYPFDDSDV